MKQRLVLVLAFALAGCGGANQAGNGQAAANGAAPAAAPAAPVAPAGGIVQMEPGEWEISMAMEGGPTLPGTRTCLTQADVERGSAAMLNGGASHHGVTCDYSGVTMSGGRIQGTSRCTRAGGMQMSMTMDGTMTPTAYDVNQQIRTTMHGQTRKSAGHMTGRRIGECAPGQDRTTAPE